jgi:hypothetical protein
VSCPSRENLLEWYDGELSDPDASQVDAHVSRCAECALFIGSVKRMENIWRADWTDPEDSAFDLFRQGLSPAVPWWKRQRSWFIAAAVFAVYLGVRIFQFGDHAPDLARMAEQEVRSNVQPTPEMTDSAAELPLEVSSEEMEEPAYAESQEEIAVEEEAFDSQDEVVTQQAIQPPVEIQDGIASVRTAASSLIHDSMAAGESVSEGIGGLSGADAAGGGSWNDLSSSSLGEDDSPSGSSAGSEEVLMLFASGACQAEEAPQHVASPLADIAAPVFSITLCPPVDGETDLSHEDWPELFQLVQSASMDAGVQGGDSWELTVDGGGSVWNGGQFIGTVQPYRYFQEGDLTLTVHFH